LGGTPGGRPGERRHLLAHRNRKANGLEPYTWLSRVLTHLPLAETVDEIEALMPWNLHAESLAFEHAP